METALGILTVLGIFVVVPAVIAGVIIGMIVLTQRRSLRAKRAAKAMEEAAVAPLEEPAEAVVGQPVGKLTKVA